MDTDIPVNVITPEEHDKTLRNSVSVLHRFVGDTEGKLRFGLRVREQLRQALLRGEKPDSYRLDWLVSASDAVFAVLGEMARQFNDDNPQDRISRQDLLDVLLTSVNRLKKHEPTGSGVEESMGDGKIS